MRVDVFDVAFDFELDLKVQVLQGTGIQKREYRKYCK